MRRDKTKIKKLLRARRHRRIRGKIQGTAERPRLSVFRSLKCTTLQLIDDEQGQTLVVVTSRTLTKSGKKRLVGVGAARETGKELARRAGEKNIARVVFDRSGYTYHGRIKAAAEGAREGGLQF